MTITSGAPVDGPGDSSAAAAPRGASPAAATATPAEPMKFRRVTLRPDHLVRLLADIERPPRQNPGLRQHEIIPLGTHVSAIKDSRCGRSKARARHFPQCLSYV